MNLNKERLKERTKQIEEIIFSYLPKEEGEQKTVIEAMNYSVQAGGKRLRPMLMQETYFMFGGDGESIYPFMAAIEMIHTYSLVHDDLPAMDNDEYRRGKKTTWAQFDECTAILAGDALLNFAFETALKAAKGDHPHILHALSILAAKAGIYGMIGGQTADIEAEKQTEVMDGESLLFIHEHKTAALIQAAMMIGAVMAGASKEETLLIEKCAYNIGIAFQIQDDILDVTSTFDILGKPIGSDEKNHKMTYVSIYGLEKSKEDVERLSEEAVSILSSFGRRNLFLEELVKQLINREK